MARVERGRLAQTVRIRTALAFLTAIPCLAFGVGVAATPAGAAGDATLDPLILTNPVPGWQQAPSSFVQPIVTRIQKLDTDAIVGSTSGSVRVASEVWTPAQGKGLFAITLVRWPQGVDNLAQVPSVAARQECVSLTGNDPSTTGTLSGIDGSVTASCAGQGTAGDVAVAVAVAIKGSVSELVESFGPATGPPPVSAGEVAALASSQYGRLPAAPSNTLDTVIGLVVIAAVLAGIGFGIRALVTGRRRRHAPQSGAALGGFPGPFAPVAPGSPLLTTYPPPPPASGWSAGPAPAGGPAPGAAHLGAPPPVAFPPAASPPATPDAVAPAEPAGVTGGSLPPLFAGAASAAPAVAPAAPVAAAVPGPHDPAAGAPAWGVSPAPAPAPSAAPAPAPPAGPGPGSGATPGWQPVPGDPTRRRYWDGATWTSTVRWDGTVWVTEP